MAIRIKLPEELRERILAFKSSFPAKAAAAAASDQAAAQEIERLETVERGLENSLPGLRREAVESDESAQKIVTTETRLKAIKDQIAKLKDAAARKSGLTLAEAGPLKGDLCAFYSGALRQAMQDAIAPFDSREHRVTETMQFLDAPLALNRIAETYLGNRPATPHNIEWLFSILDRFLRGEPHLGMDRLSKEIAET